MANDIPAAYQISVIPGSGCMNADYPPALDMDEDFLAVGPPSFLQDEEDKIEEDKSRRRSSFFRSVRVLSATATIQRVIRFFLSHRYAAKKRQSIAYMLEQEELTASAINIQRNFRGYLARKDVAKKNPAIGQRVTVKREEMELLRSAQKKQELASQLEQEWADEDKKFQKQQQEGTNRLKEVAVALTQASLSDNQRLALLEEQLYLTNALEEQKTAYAEKKGIRAERLEQSDVKLTVDDRRVLRGSAALNRTRKVSGERSIVEQMANRRPVGNQQKEHNDLCHRALQKQAMITVLENEWRQREQAFHKKQREHTTRLAEIQEQLAQNLSPEVQFKLMEESLQVTELQNAERTAYAEAAKEHIEQLEKPEVKLDAEDIRVLRGMNAVKTQRKASGTSSANNRFQTANSKPVVKHSPEPRPSNAKLANGKIRPGSGDALSSKLKNTEDADAHFSVMEELNAILEKEIFGAKLKNATTAVMVVQHFARKSQGLGSPAADGGSILPPIQSSCYSKSSAHGVASSNHFPPLNEVEPLSARSRANKMRPGSASLLQRGDSAEDSIHHIHVMDDLQYQLENEIMTSKNSFASQSLVNMMDAMHPVR